MSNLILSIFSGLILALSFPRAEQSLFAWFGFVFLFKVLKKVPSCRKAFLFSYLCGLIFFSVVTYWIVYVSFIGAFVFFLYLALYFGIFGAGVKWVEDKFDNVIIKVFLIASLWTALEFIRSYVFSGFGWALLGYSQCKNVKLIQIADITGAYGISFLIVFVNVVIFYLHDITSVFNRLNETLALKNMKNKVEFFAPRVIIFLLALGFIWGSLKYGNERIENFKARKEDLLKVSVVQGNIPQEIKWDNVSTDLILDKYEKLSGMAAFDKPEVIIWPETALPGYLNEKALRQKVSRLSISIATPLLIGAPRFLEDEDVYFNSAVFFDKKGEIAGIYDKLHLVPFGEYLPFRRILSPLTFFYPIADFSGGKKYHLFEIKNVRFGTLICFEDVFDNLTRNFIKEGADFMVNITNDAWFKESSEPYQHNQALVFRAVENKISAVRAGNTGQSLFIEPTGVIKARLVNMNNEDIFIDGFLTDNPSRGMMPTFFTKYGNVFAYACAAFFAVVCFWRRRFTKN
ncbi:MAG: apolipoprotein N-acyltransferase [Candidatus Omnitrophota bacterium]